MQIFPAEYKPHIKRYHQWVAMLSGLLLFGGITSMALLTIAPSGFFNGPLRKILGGAIVFGIPAGLILLILVISLVSYQYNKRKKELLGSKELVSSSINQRAIVLQTIAHLKYDYRKANNNSSKATKLLIVPFAVIGTLLIIYDPQPAHALFIGILFLLGPLCAMGLSWLVLIKPRESDYIELSADGIHYQTKGRRSLLPWNKAKEIQNLRGSFAITSEDERLIIWSDIEPTDIPSESFFAGIFRERTYVFELIESIMKLAPHIYQKQSFLARDLKLPVPNKVIVVFLLTLVLLFIIVIIRGIANI